MSLTYVIGDATQPQGAGNKFILHCCNNIGAWGAGFVRCLSARWYAPEARYRDWFKAKPAPVGERPIYPPFELGQIQYVTVEYDTCVVNMIGQSGIGPDARGVPPIRYSAIADCLHKFAHQIMNLGDFSNITNPSAHCPRFGAGLAGGDWARIEEIINKELVANNIPVTVYDLPVIEKEINKE